MQHILAAVAIKLIRLVAWLREPVPMPRRSSAFLRVAAATGGVRQQSRDVWYTKRIMFERGW